MAMDRYMNTCLDLSMHGSESQANNTTINVLSDENNRLKQEIADLNTALYNANTML